MLFTDKECEVLRLVVIEYDFQPRLVLRADLQHTLAESCLQKLEALNPFTHFTKQEFTFLLLAAHFAKNRALPSYKSYPTLIKGLIPQLEILAEP